MSLDTKCRKLLEEAVSQELEGKFSIYIERKSGKATGNVVAEVDARMPHLSDEERSARKDILDHFAHIKARSFKLSEALEQLVRETAFTHLNRLCAYKMMEAREVYVGGTKFREAVSRGVNSNGVKFYLADHPEDERLYNTGHQDIAYRHFLDWLGGLLSEEIGVLFSPNDPANRLHPPQKTLNEVLDCINDPALAEIWVQDETIGWVYQYFTPKELRDQARKESQVPRNSYELAFRNQFFTPRYVVEFLTDNTLGRIWYEMRKGETKLKDQCRYMVRRPNEVFLTEGQQPPKDAAEGRPDLSQVELLKLPVHIVYRPKKDPRDIKLLDPASGSGHFLLYGFDLLVTIYEEAYTDPDLGPALQKDYPTLADLKRAVPSLILAHNLHGIDIDLRASQIAALALWLRCQRAYQDLGLKADRPKITRSNFVCAEPMPGEDHMLKEFVGQIEPKLLGQLVEVVFDKMKLAGEAGSLLKIEEELRAAVASAKAHWSRVPIPEQLLLFGTKPQQPVQQTFDFSGITDAQFFEQAEAKVVEALRLYAEKAHNGQQLQRRLFTEDAVRGFAFVEICHKRFDVVVMNPPFGEPTARLDPYLRSQYRDNWKDLYAAFIERQTNLLVQRGVAGAITSSLFLYTKQLRALRASFVHEGDLDILVELGDGVLDTAMVEVALTIRSLKSSANRNVYAIFQDATQIDHDARAHALRGSDFWSNPQRVYIHRLDRFASVAESPFCYHMPESQLSLWMRTSRVGSEIATVATGNTTFDNERFIRLRHECPFLEVGRRWFPYEKGGDFHLFYGPSVLMLNWQNDGEELRANERAHFGTDARSIQSISLWFRAGLTYPRVSSIGFGVRALPEGHIFSAEGISLFTVRSEDRLPLLALLNSTWASDLIMAQGRYRKTENRAVKDLPFTTDDLVVESGALTELARRAVNIAREAEFHDETSPIFVSPFAGLPGAPGALQELVELTAHWHRELARLLDEIDTISGRSLFGPSHAVTPRSERKSTLVDRFLPPSTGNRAVCEQSKRLTSWLLGCAIGRWRPTVSMDEIQCVREADPFGAIPASPLAAIRVDESCEGDVHEMLTDDPESAADILRGVLSVLEAVWKDRADKVENEMCAHLGVETLREYFRNPSKRGFWDDHVSRYSKSRRNAPIYWLLQSSKRNFALWLYYHRLDKDMLFKALVNYVEPKIRLESSRLDALRSQMAAAGGSGTEAKRLSKEVEEQEDFISELRDFEDKLRRAADLHLVPDLNDGVVLNIAPLHELVPWKEAKIYWDELLEGKHEWSSIGKQLREKGLVK